MTARRCMVCGGYYAAAPITGLLRCTRCGFVSADLDLSQQELEKLYNREYFLGVEYRDYVAERALIEKNFRMRLCKLLKFVKEPSSKRLLEIGCAYGFFLALAQAYFASVSGVDISREAIAYARERLRLPVSNGDFLECEVSGPVDVACLWDTIEHIARPDLYVEKLGSIMTSGGILAITTADIESAVARLRGHRWRQIHPPTHLHYFSRRSLTRFLERFEYEVVYCGYDGMYRSMDTIAHIVLNVKHKYGRVYRALKAMGLLEWDLYLNLHDILFMIARKK